MSEPLEEIVVYGSGPSGGFDWGTFDFGFDNVVYDQESGSGGGVSSEVDQLDQTDFTAVSFPNGVILLVDLSTLPDVVVNALLYIADNLDQFPAVENLFNDLKAQGYTEIQFRAHPTHSLNADGSLVQSFGDYNPLAGVSADAAFVGASDPSVGETYAVITFNLTNYSGADFETALEDILHEVSHAVHPSWGETEANNNASSLLNEIQGIQPGYNGNTGQNGYNDAEHGVGNSGDNQMNGAAGHDHIEGNAGNDSLYGKGGNDLLVGGSGNDRLFGGAGNDELIAGAGSDELYGSSGDDKYVFDVNLSGSIGDTSGTGDYIDIQTTSNVSFSQSGDSLHITDNNTGQVLQVFNWFNGQEIEIVSLANGSVFSSAIINEIINLQGGGLFDTGGGLLPPIVLDLDGDGIELVNLDDSNTKIDLDGDGKKDETGWVSSDDGILVFDQNGNNKVDGVDEFTFTQFGENSETDLEGLASFDDNGDGLINSDDAIWDDLLIWRDFNQNGKSSSKELFTLDELGIQSIGLSSNGELSVNEGNVVFGTTEFTRTDGTVGIAGDVALRSDIYGYEWQETSDLHNAIVDHFAGL